jgi:fluoride ion exporter CrcB/FEX
LKLTGRVILFTYLGGALGTLLRFWVSVSVTQNLISLMIVNLLGAAALGWFNGDHRFDSVNSKAFWSVGFAGGFTTMSGVAIWFLDYSSFGVGAPIIVVLMFALGIFCYWSGLLLGRRYGKDAPLVEQA